MKIGRILNSTNQTYLLYKPIEEHNTNSRKFASQAVIISFIIVIFSAIRIESKLEKERKGEIEVS